MDSNQVIEQITSIQRRNRVTQSAWRLFVRVLAPGTLGGTPCEPVTQLTGGIDWDRGKIILDTRAPLTRLSPDDVAAIHDSARNGQSWHAYQSYKRQADRIRSLEAQVAQLQGQLEAAHSSNGRPR